MKKERQVNEREIRTFCAVADIVLNGTGRAEAAKHWVIGYNPVLTALAMVDKAALRNIAESFIQISIAQNRADDENKKASSLSRKKQKLRSLADSLGFDVVERTKEKKIQNTLF